MRCYVREKNLSGRYNTTAVNVNVQNIYPKKDRNICIAATEHSQKKRKKANNKSAESATGERKTGVGRTGLYTEWPEAKLRTTMVMKTAVLPPSQSLTLFDCIFSWYCPL